MAEQQTNPIRPEESHLIYTFLYQALQDVRQDVRDLHTRMDETRRETSGQIDELAKRFDSRFGKLTATMIAMTSVIVAAIGVMASVLRP